MRLVCSYCGRDLNAIGQDNMSYTLNEVICEDCAGHDDESFVKGIGIENLWSDEYEERKIRNED